VVGAGRIDPGFARGAVLVDAVELEVLEPLGIIHAFDDRAARGEYLFDRAYELVFLDQDRLDQVVGLEADFLQAAQAGRFGHADVQPLAALEQRQRAMPGDEFLLDQPGRTLGQVQRIDVEQRNAELGRRGMRDVAAVGERVLGQPGAERDLLVRGVRDRLARFDLAERALGDESPCEARQRRLRRWIHLGCHECRLNPWGRTSNLLQSALSMNARRFRNVACRTVMCAAGALMATIRRPWAQSVTGSKRFAATFLRTRAGSQIRPFIAMWTPSARVCTAPTAQPMLKTASDPRN